MNNADAAQVKELVLSILAERRELDDERKENLMERFRAQETAIVKAEESLRDVLRGFPQEYAKAVELDGLREQIAGIKQDHVQRREFDDLRDEQRRGQGRRTILAGLVGIAVGVLALMFGLLRATQLTHADISNQIAREAPTRSEVSQQIAVEAPWLAERGSVFSRLTALERDHETTSIEFARLEDHEARECRLDPKVC